jgi:hypothetical protein
MNTPVGQISGSDATEKLERTIERLHAESATTEVELVPSGYCCGGVGGSGAAGVAALRSSGFCQTLPMTLCFHSPLWLTSDMPLLSWSQPSNELTSREKDHLVFSHFLRREHSLHYTIPRPKFYLSHNQTLYPSPLGAGREQNGLASMCSFLHAAIEMHAWAVYRYSVWFLP